jgi:hypothetical protein
MSGGPIRKHELVALEALARGQGGLEPDDVIMQRLRGLGLVEHRSGNWHATQRGKMDLIRRKSLKRSTR